MNLKSLEAARYDMVRKRGANYEWNPAFNNGRDPEYDDIEEVMNDLNELGDAAGPVQGQIRRSRMIEEARAEDETSQPALDARDESDDWEEEDCGSGMRQGQRRRFSETKAQKIYQRMKLERTGRSKSRSRRSSSSRSRPKSMSRSRRTSRSRSRSRARPSSRSRSRRRGSRSRR